MPPLHLREARPEDLGAIDAIYNHYVLTSDCTLQLEPGTAGERAAWFTAQGPLPVLVAEEEGAVVGWGALVRFQPRAGYRFTVEDSVYVRHDARGRGIGRALLVELITRARALGAHCIVGKITGQQAGSLALHAQLGFTEVGRLREVGFKFDRWVDVVLVQRML